MTLTTDKQLGPYEILSPLGAGGMGEVWRARDTRLDREVAIKVLPADFASDADRLKRFEQEARATSALNHPNILTVHDIGNYEGSPYLVSELLEGEVLRAQLNDGPLPSRQAVEYARQIAAGLAAAHEKGIVHRDLKPENLFVTRDGRVKILDFGLAKLKRPQVGDVESQAPTQKKITDPGTVMGTVGYMSPEQVRGQEADHRTDIFSFGVILYEMLSGRRAFGGESAVEVMNAILKEDPPELGETNSKVSPQLEKIVRRCLEKKPERRFQSASDLGFALEALSAPSDSRLETQAGFSATTANIGVSFIRRRERQAWLGAMMTLALFAFGMAYFRRPAPEAETLRLFVNPPEKATRFDLPTISPDGRTLAFVATVEGKTQLWARPLNSATATPLAEIGAIEPPFWSPDSRFICYAEGDKLKKIALAGGEPETLYDSLGAFSLGAWNREGIILLSAGPRGIMRISANGGAMTAVTTVDSSRGETHHTAPLFLPDGRHFIFYIITSDPATRGTYLASIDGKEKRLVLPLDNPAVGVAVNPGDGNEGYLVYRRQGALLVQFFDFSREQPVGEPLRLAPQVKIATRVPLMANYVQASLSANGALVLIEGNANEQGASDNENHHQLNWFDRAGKKLGTVGRAGIYYSIPRLSPNGKRLAVARSDTPTGNAEIYLFDLAGDTEQRLTFNSALDVFPYFSPDGSRIVWTSYRDGVGNLYQKAASGAGPDMALHRSDYPKFAVDWSRDGRFIIYREIVPQTKADLLVLSLEDGKSWPWLKTDFNEEVGRFSPDGKWIAYNTNDSGRSEIYMQEFAPGAPASGGRWMLSTNGGRNPQWRRGGGELYYISLDNKLMAVEVMFGAEVKRGTPKELFALNDIRANPNASFAVTPDGQRFLFVTSAEETSVTPFTVVLNWMAEIKK